jgi:hypothetical protein
MVLLVCTSGVLGCLWYYSCALPVYWDASGITRVHFRCIGILMVLSCALPVYWDVNGVIMCTSGVLGC